MLTVAQQKIAEENHNLIYFLLNSIHVSAEDYYGEAAVGLCKAANTWDSQKGAFSTWACYIMKNEIFMTMRGNWKGSPMASIDEELSSTEGLSLADMLGYEPDFSYSEVSEILKQILSEVNPIESKILGLVLKGKTQIEIGEIVSMSQPYISRLLRRLRKKYKKISLS